MKKLISAAAAVAVASALSFSASAAVPVTITDENGQIVLAQKNVELTDKDGDGALTVNDALIAAHDEYFEGGSEAGYGYADGDYGLMMTKLWGVENGGSYGYYVNTSSAMSLADPISDNDSSITAFIYTDTAGYSDTFCYFDGFVTEYGVTVLGGAPGAPLELKLCAATFDENWAPITVPVAGAEITIDGKKTGFVTDDEGKVDLSFPEEYGTYTVSAVSDTMTLVPPVAIIETEDMSADDVGEVDAVVSPAAGDVAAATDSSKGSPDTGIADTAVVAGIAVIAAGAFVVSKKRK